MKMLVCISQWKLSSLVHKISNDKKIAEKRRTLQWIQRVLSENTSSRETYAGRHPKGRKTIVEPRFSEGPSDWQNVLYTEVIFHICYYYWGEENRSLYRGLQYKEVRYIEVPLLKTRDLRVFSLCQSCIQYSSCATISAAATCVTSYWFFRWLSMFAEIYSFACPFFRWFIFVFSLFLSCRLANASTRPIWSISVWLIRNRLEQRFSSVANRRHQLVS